MERGNAIAKLNLPRSRLRRFAGDRLVNWSWVGSRRGGWRTGRAQQDEHEAAEKRKKGGRGRRMGSKEGLLCASSARSRWRHASGPPPLIIGSLLISTNEPRAPSIPVLYNDTQHLEN